MALRGPHMFFSALPSTSNSQCWCRRRIMHQTKIGICRLHPSKCLPLLARLSSLSMPCRSVCSRAWGFAGDLRNFLIDRLSGACRTFGSTNQNLRGGRGVEQRETDGGRAKPEPLFRNIGCQLMTMLPPLGPPAQITVHRDSTLAASSTRLKVLSIYYNTYQL